MIIVLGHAIVRPGAIDEALGLAHEHVARSRAEPGCIAHAVHIDGENPDRLIFIERWADMAALKTHFAVPESGAFVRALRSLCSEPPAMQLYSAEPLDIPTG